MRKPLVFSSKPWYRLAVNDYTRNICFWPDARRRLTVSGAKNEWKQKQGLHQA